MPTSTDHKVANECVVTRVGRRCNDRRNSSFISEQDRVKLALRHYEIDESVIYSFKLALNVFIMTIFPHKYGVSDIYPMT